jgi:hypothetical protein
MGVKKRFDYGKGNMLKNAMRCTLGGIDMKKGGENNPKFA